ncbi:MAG: ribosome maturation factor RimM [Bdellovibrionia bacterium]
MKLIGKVKEAHGLKGDLYVLVFSGEVSWLPRLKTFAVKSAKASAEDMQTFTVQRVKPFKQGFIVKANEIENRNQSEVMKGWEFYIDSELLVSKAGESIYLGEIQNFTVKNPEQVIIGKITGFGSNGAQDLLVIEKTDGKSSEIPFVEAYLKKIDFKNQSIIMDLPEGLLSLDEIE